MRRSVVALLALLACGADTQAPTVEVDVSTLVPFKSLWFPNKADPFKIADIEPGCVAAQFEFQNNSAAAQVQIRTGLDITGNSNSIWWGSVTPTDLTVKSGLIYVGEWPAIFASMITNGSALTVTFWKLAP